jgi:hypothetical protein
MAASTSNLSSRARERVALLRVDQLFRTIRTAIRAGAVGFAFWCLYLLGDAVAGKSTAVTVGLSFLWDLRLVFAFSIAGATTLWAIGERFLRHRKVESMQGRIRELELKIDPKRSTSGLTPKGKTNPGDRG